MTSYVHEVRLPLAPYHFEWSAGRPEDCETTRTEQFTEEHYRYPDGTTVVIRQYPADGSFRIMSDRGPIDVLDHARDPSSPQSVSVVRLP
jgi:hypothetical protein